MEQYVNMKSPFTGGRVKEIFAAISKILGFGINQYANYENGQVPSESNGKMILAAKNKSFIISLLDSSREQFTEAEYMKIRNSILSAPEESISDKLLYEAGVFITPGFIFGRNGVNYLRISLCAPVPVLREAYNRIERVL